MESRLSGVDSEHTVDLLNTIGNLCYRLVRLPDAWRWMSDAAAMARRLKSERFMTLCAENDSEVADMVSP